MKQGKKRQLEETGDDAAASSRDDPSSRLYERPATAKKKGGEKRARRWSSTANEDTRARIGRALSQRMYLLSSSSEDDERTYEILGSTGNCYSVLVGSEPRCSCPDAAKGNLCKHVLFVMLRVLRCDPQSPIVYQKALLASERRRLFEAYDARTAPICLASAAARAAFNKARGSPDEKEEAAGSKKKEVTEEDDCAVCFEGLLSGGAALVSCEVCRNSLHAACMSQWSAANRGAEATCPVCRAPWTTSAKKQAPVVEGYLNLAGHQGGLRTARDTSTYRDTSYYGHHNRWGRR